MFHLPPIPLIRMSSALMPGLHCLPGNENRPGFWYQGYQRSLSGGYEFDAKTGPPGWRLRFTPPEIGSYALSLTISTNGQPSGWPVITNFSVPAGPLPARCGYVGIALGHQYFQTGDGQPLRLIGENVCWGMDRPPTATTPGLPPCNARVRITLESG